MPILWVALFSLLGSLGAISTAAAFLLLWRKIPTTLLSSLVALATGTLLGAALLGLLSHALSQAPSISILSTVLVGILLFFFIEKLVIWRHCHDLDCPVHGVAGPMILLGDICHNATDGLVMAASFLSSLPVGIAVSLSVIAHEIPQEVGDFAILLNSDYSKRRAFTLNLLSSLSTAPAAIIAYYTLNVTRVAIPYVMALSAASFLYIALTDLYPELHQKRGFGNAAQQFIMLLVGVGIMSLLLTFHP